MGPPLDWAFPWDQTVKRLQILLHTRITCHVFMVLEANGNGFFWFGLGIFIYSDLDISIHAALALNHYFKDGQLSSWMIDWVLIFSLWFTGLFPRLYLTNLTLKLHGRWCCLVYPGVGLPMSITSQILLLNHFLQSLSYIQETDRFPIDLEL